MGVTIYDVARHAKVSPRTVSNVVNNYPFVSAETRRRVKESLDALGYRPNLMARNLRRGRTGLVAVIVPELGVPYFSELCQAIIDQASEGQSTVIIEQTEGDPQTELRVMDTFRTSHMVDGVIFSPLGLGPNELASLRGDTPVVLLGERVSDGPFDHVSIDNIAASRDAIAHLVASGRRRVAAIGDQPYETGETAQLRTMGYRQALAEAGLAYQDELVVPVTHFHRDAGKDAMEQLLALEHRPDAVFCYNDLLAVGALRALWQQRIRVPDDIAVVGFDDIEEGRYYCPTLTTVSPHKVEIASLAIEQLFRRIDGDGGEPADLEAGYHLEIRESAAALR